LGRLHAFTALLISTLLCLGTLGMAWLLNRHPDELKCNSAKLSLSKRFSKTHWLYLAAGALISAGFANFSLTGFHFKKAATVPQSVVPVFYAVAMASGPLAALVSGKLLDKIGIPVVVLAFGTAAFFAPLLFLGGTKLALVSMILWAIGMGVQDSSLKAILSGVVPAEKRSTALGIFDTGFGVAWFAGSVIMGLLYDKSISPLIIFSMILQFLALPAFAFARNKETKHR
jgi:predicted MFS family arabinose efflux permease